MVSGSRTIQRRLFCVFGSASCHVKGLSVQHPFHAEEDFVNYLKELKVKNVVLLWVNNQILFRV